MVICCNSQPSTLEANNHVELIPAMKVGRVYTSYLNSDAYHILEPDSVGEYVKMISIKPKYTWYAVDNVDAVGSWVSASGQPKFYKTTFHYTNTVAAHLTYTFNGCGVKVFSELYPQNGTVTIWIDDDTPLSYSLKGEPKTNHEVFNMSVPCDDHVLHMRKDVADGSASVDYFHVKKLTP